ncbi:MAG TPA: hypothetical protein VKB57_14530 [Acidimicrobiales bacterium]|nr:hypothetical protein [Acidimicrobiales bacterium]
MDATSLSLIAAALAVVAALAAWLWPRSPKPPSIPSFSGGLHDPDQVREFIDFLDRHELGRARLDISMPGDVAHPEGNVLAARSFHLADPNGNHGGYEVLIRGGEVAARPLTYAHGVWRLESYVAVERPSGVWQGILARALVPISLADIAR